MKETKFHTKNSFSILILQMSKNKKISCIDALLLYCNENDIDVEDIAQYISSALKEQILIEAQEQNRIKTNIKKLPI